jgi:hypothetical protein
MGVKGYGKIRSKMSKHYILRNKDGVAIHVRRNMWGHIVHPSRAMANFKDLQKSGFYHPDYTWEMCCAAYRKKIRKMQIAKASRRRNRR